MSRAPGAFRRRQSRARDMRPLSRPPRCVAGNDPGVPDHVAVRVVAQNEIVLAFLDRAAQTRRSRRARSSRGIRSYVATFWLGTSSRSSPGIRRLDAAVEEVRHVRVLLRLRRAKHASCPARRAPRRRCASHRLRRKRDRQVERLRRTWSSSRRVSPRPVADVESVESGFSERADDLPHAVRAVVEADQPRRRRASGDRLRRPASTTTGLMNSSRLAPIVRLPNRLDRVRRRRRRRRGPSRGTTCSVRSQRLSRSIP